MSGSRPAEGSEPWLRRYARQVVLEGFGEEGQRRLGRATVLVAGSGPAVVACALHLAAAGLGHVRVSDAEPVPPSEAAAWPLSPSDAGAPRDEAVVRMLVALGHDASVVRVLRAPQSGPGTGLLAAGDDLLGVGGVQPNDPWIALASDGGGGVTVGPLGARPPRAGSPLPGPGPVLFAGAALAADAAMRRIVTGEAPRGSLRVLADGRVVGG